MIISEEILASEADAKQYIKQELAAIKSHPKANENLAMLLHLLNREERFQMLMKKIAKIIK